MSAVESTRVVLHADKEHAGLRLVVLTALLASYIASFFLIGWLFDSLASSRLADYATFISCVGGLPLALLATWGLENLLKKTWHSGLSVELHRDGVEVNDTRRRSTLHAIASAPSLKWNEAIRVTNWYFSLAGYPRGGRERRIDKNWVCMGTELQQGDTRLIVYTFLPPREVEQVLPLAPESLAFRRLTPADVYDSSLRSRFAPPTRPSIPADVLHGQDGRYWLAERRRWEAGIELVPEDYRTFLGHTFAHYSIHDQKAANGPEDYVK